MRHVLVAAALCAVASPAFAQSAAPLPASAGVPLQVAAPVVTNAVLRTGVEVPLRLLEELTTKEKKLRAGERFRLETSEPILVQGMTVIPVGTPAIGEITDVRNKGMWGKSGRFTARLLYLTLNGRQIRLSGNFDDKGHAGGAGAVAVSALVFLPAGFFMTGTSAHLPAGTAVTGAIDEDVPLNLPAAPQSAVLTVPAPGGMPGRALTPVAATAGGVENK
ncbi:MAG TPA: hypothetical protein VLM18_04870 [Croceibacterium sp.]|nr:hypothetical protein [Croceibacterium sp.]